jgi:hypothetical protein
MSRGMYLPSGQSLIRQCEKSELIHANTTIPPINFFSPVSPETFQQPAGQPGALMNGTNLSEQSLEHK